MDIGAILWPHGFTLDPRPYLDALVQGAILLPFALGWAIRRYRPYLQWQATRRLWHHPPRIGEGDRRP